MKCTVVVKYVPMALPKLSFSAARPRTPGDTGASSV
jgi:hypothetical protein